MVLSFPKLAQAAGVPEMTCRRYAKRAPRLFLAWTRDGVTRFPPEAVERFQLAHRTMASGQRWPEVARLIQERFPQTYDVEPDQQDEQSVAVETAPAVLTGNVAKIADALVVIAKQSARLDRLETENAELLRRLEAVEARFLLQDGQGGAVDDRQGAGGGNVHGDGQDAQEGLLKRIWVAIKGRG